ncbi:hypothetical protein CI238_01543, partial [Colletotrichum incanum]
LRSPIDPIRRTKSSHIHNTSCPRSSPPPSSRAPPPVTSRRRSSPPSPPRTARPRPPSPALTPAVTTRATPRSTPRPRRRPSRVWAAPPQPRRRLRTSRSTLPTLRCWSTSSSSPNPRPRNFSRPTTEMRSRR